MIQFYFKRIAERGQLLQPRDACIVALEAQIAKCNTVLSCALTQRNPGTPSNNGQRFFERILSVAATAREQGIQRLNRAYNTYLAATTPGFIRKISWVN